MIAIWFRPPARIDRPERLDDQRVPDPALFAGSLDDVWRVNRWLGGAAAVERDLTALLAAPPAPVRFLDVGTGSGALPLALLRWASRRGLVADVEAVDLHPRAVEVARRRTAGQGRILVRRADALALPYPAESFDVALSVLTLHHLRPDEAARALREMERVTRVGFVVSDLLRCWSNLVGARLLAAGVWRNPITRHDGPLSVLRSYTLAEWREIVRRSGVRARVRGRFPFRVSIVGERGLPR